MWRRDYAGLMYSLCGAAQGDRIPNDKLALTA